MTKSSAEIADLLRELASAAAISRPGGCPSWYRLDKWRFGELDAAAALAVQTHVEQCAHCQRQLAEEVQKFAASGSQRAAVPVRPRKRWTTATLWAAPALAVAAAFALFGPGSRGAVVEHKHANRGAIEDRVRSKGGPAIRFTVFREHQGLVEKLANDSAVIPGDRLRFEVELLEDSWIMIAGVEANSNVFAYYPLDTDRAAFQKMGRSLLASTVELDASLGREQIMLVACRKPFALGSLRAAALEDCSRATLRISKAPP